LFKTLKYTLARMFSNEIFECICCIFMRTTCLPIWSYQAGSKASKLYSGSAWLEFPPGTPSVSSPWSLQSSACAGAHIKQWKLLST
jgi:hypothetical protein